MSDKPAPEEIHKASSSQPASVPKQLLSSFLCQKQWLFLGAAMVVVGSWPGWLPFFFPDATQKYLSGLLGPSLVAVPSNDHALSQEIIQLKQEIETTRLQAKERAPDALEQKIDALVKITIQTTTWQNLQDRLTQGRPYADELALLERVATPVQKSDLTILAPYAPLGVPSDNALITELERYLETEKKTTSSPDSHEGENPVTRFFKDSWESLKNLVKISKEGDPRFTQSLSLDQALDFLKQGKLEACVSLVTTAIEKQKIEDLPQPLAAWLTHAKARLVIDPVLGRLREYGSSTRDLLSLVPAGVSPHVA